MSNYVRHHSASTPRKRQVSNHKTLAFDVTSLDQIAFDEKI